MGDTTWTQQETQDLIRLWNSGYTARDISIHIKTHSRSAVLGKIFRLKAINAVVGRHQGERPTKLWIIPQLKKLPRTHQGKTPGNRLCHREDEQDFFNPETFGKGFQ